MRGGKKTNHRTNCSKRDCCSWQVSGGVTLVVTLPCTWDFVHAMLPSPRSPRDLKDNADGFSDLSPKINPQRLLRKKLENKHLQSLTQRKLSHIAFFFGSLMLISVWVACFLRTST